MIFIDPSFFTGELHIPNLENSDVKDYEFFKLATEWELECLELAFGKCLAEELISQFEITGEDGSKKYQLKSGVDPKWSFLIDGRKYSKADSLVSHFSNLSVLGCGCNSSSNCNYHFWDGIVKKQDVIVEGKVLNYKTSFIADFVYYKWSFYNESVTTGTGEQSPESKNSSKASNKIKRTNAYNSFWAKVKSCESGGKVGLHLFLNEHAESFENFIEHDFCYHNIWDV